MRHKEKGEPEHFRHERLAFASYGGLGPTASQITPPAPLLPPLCYPLSVAAPTTSSSSSSASSSSAAAGSSSSAGGAYAYGVGMAMGMSMTSDPLHHSMNGLSYGHGICSMRPQMIILLIQR